MDLLSNTKRLATTIPFDRAAVCRELGVSSRWLQMVLAGKITEPSVVKIQRLHDLLAKAGESDAA